METAVKGKVDRLRELYESINRKHKLADIPEYNELLASLEKEGCRLEHAWGVYLHLPDGGCITLDYWNDEQDLTSDMAGAKIDKMGEQ
jgi:hypothetical protein